MKLALHRLVRPVILVAALAAGAALASLWNQPCDAGGPRRVPGIKDPHLTPTNLRNPDHTLPAWGESSRRQTGRNRPIREKRSRRWRTLPEIGIIVSFCLDNR